MKVTYFMVAAYIAFCVRHATQPCKYFQLNSPFFDGDKGIFSKDDINEMVPPRWRLAQFRDDGLRQPERYPVFVKPEWSQNANGVRRADSAGDLTRIRADIAQSDMAESTVDYLIQAAAVETNEYEIFSMRHHLDRARWAFLTVTQARNDVEAHPINGIRNKNTHYTEITASLSTEQRARLWAHVRQIGDFSLSRVSACADSMDELLRGNFHVIEVNLFLPMPINLLDDQYSRADIFHFVMASMRSLALLTKHRDKNLMSKPVFSKNMLYNRRGKLLNFLRAMVSAATERTSI